MSQTSIISIRIDNGLKSRFNDFCERTGMSMSTAVNMYMQNVVQNQSLPFRVTTMPRAAKYDPKDPFWGEENQKHLRRSIDELESGHWVVHDTEEIEAMI